MLKSNCSKVAGNHNQFIRSTVWSLRAKDFQCLLTICLIKNESILDITSHLNCASSLIPRNSSCRKRGGIRGENNFNLIQRRTTKSVWPPKGDVVIFHWIQCTWRSRNKGWCLLFVKKEKNHIWESLMYKMVYFWSQGERKEASLLQSLRIQHRRKRQANHFKLR